MALYTLRVWVPDRPGALGAVASRIGAVRGDLIGIDILERGGGRAIDELVVDLPSADLVDLLVAEVSEVDGVDVEDVRRASDALADPRLDALETAAGLVAQPAAAPMLGLLVRSSLRDFECDWSCVTDPAQGDPEVAVGGVPPVEWLRAFLAGSRVSLAPAMADSAASGPTSGSAPEDVAWADLDAAGLVLVLGRRGRAFRLRERRQLTALARIADARWAELAARSAVVSSVRLP